MRDLNVCLARVASVLALLLVATESRAAAARGRMAVVVVAAGDAELGDNLTEAAISSLADRGDYELVGARELRDVLVDGPPVPKLEACVVQAACLARLGAAAGTRRAVVGEVHRDDAGFAIRLALVDTVSGATDAEWSRVVPADVESLVSAVGSGVRALFAAQVAATRAPVSTPAVSLDAISPGGSAPALHVDTNKGDAPDGYRRGHARAGYLGAAALALAVVAFSAAAVTGNAAEAPLLGSTRADMQSDLRRRDGYATVANGLLVAGGGLTLTAGALFTWWWRADGANTP